MYFAYPLNVSSYFLSARFCFNYVLIYLLALTLLNKWYESPFESICVFRVKMCTDYFCCRKCLCKLERKFKNIINKIFKATGSNPKSVLLYPHKIIIIYKFLEHKSSERLNFVDCTFDVCVT